MAVRLANLLLVTLLCLQHQEPSFQNETFLAARVVKQTADTNWNINTLDFSPISSRLLEQRQNASELEVAPFLGPKLLRPLVGQCFLFDDSKYIFRVCPFANVTQHEKSQYAFNFLTSSFHAILGIWRYWYVSENTFDSLLYLQGDRCEQGIARRVRLQLHCSDDWTMVDLAYVKNVTEVEKCIYHAQLASTLFCDLGSVYSRLDSTGQLEWDQLETAYRNGDITSRGYEHYLQSMLAKYGLTTRDETLPLHSKKSKGVAETDINSSSDAVNLCETRVKRLEAELAELKLMINATNKAK